MQDTLLAVCMCVNEGVASPLGNDSSPTRLRDLEGTDGVANPSAHSRPSINVDE